MKYPLLALIRLYQWTVSPLLGPVCRFYPSCSRYGYEAIATHGAIYGSYLTLRRLLRCHPWNPGGIDTVPPRSARPWWAPPLMRQVRQQARSGHDGDRSPDQPPEPATSPRPVATTPPQGDPR